MTPEQLVCISIGWITLAGTFALGVAVGCSIRRKESQHDSDDGAVEEGEAWRVHDSE